MEKSLASHVLGVVAKHLRARLDIPMITLHGLLNRTAIPVK